MFTSLRGRLRNLFRRNRIESEIDAELRFHVEMAIQVNLAAGMTPKEARRVALRDLGGVMHSSCFPPSFATVEPSNRLGRRFLVG